MFRSRDVRAFRFIATILFFSMFFSGCDPGSITNTPAWEKIVEALKISQAPNKGMQYFNKGRYEEAIDIWLEELKMTPNNPSVQNNIGLAYRRLGDSQMAIHYLKRAIELKPGYGRYYYNLGLVHYDLKEFAQAKQNFLKALELKYIHADVHYSLGQAQKYLNDFEQAEISFQRVVELNPSFPGAHYQLGECYMATKKFALAQRAYKKELEMNPLWGETVKEAILEMETRMNPGNPETFFALGMLHKEGKREENLKKAMAAFHQVIKLKASFPEAHLQLGELYERQGDFLTANYEYRQEIHFYSKSEKAIKALGRLRGKMEKAIDPAKFFSPNSSFAGITLPQEGIVAVEKAELYDESYLRKGELPRGKTLQIQGIYDRALKKNDHSPYEFLFVLDKKKGLINIRDVILKMSYGSPAFLSPAKKIQIIKNPIAHLLEERPKSMARHFSLWLKAEGREPLFLGNYAERQAEDLSKLVSWSPDERYLFVPFLRKVLSADGSMVLVLNDSYTSPVWYEETLFLRGRGEDDAVYSLNLKTKEFKKFLDLSEGLRFLDTVKGELAVWEPAKIEKGMIKAKFTRIDLHPAEKDRHCMTLEVTADQYGNILNKSMNWDSCN